MPVLNWLFLVKILWFAGRCRSQPFDALFESGFLQSENRIGGGWCTHAALVRLGGCGSFGC